MKNFVFVSRSFNIKDTYMTHDGHVMLWKSEEDFNAYIEAHARGEDDRLFEHKWKYVVLEKVSYGPYSFNDVVSWWKMVHYDRNTTQYEKLDKSPMPEYDGVQFNNFTISG